VRSRLPALALVVIGAVGWATEVSAMCTSSSLPLDTPMALVMSGGGAKGAYEMIVKAFAAGDRTMLRNLLAPNVMASFDTAIAGRESDGVTETVEFLHAPRADLEKAEMVGAGDLARLTVRFLAEFRSRSHGPEGEAVEDRRTAELWTFERNLRSRDPNWTLVHVDAAEA